MQFAARRLTDERVKLLVAARLEADARQLQLERDLSDVLLRIGAGPLSMRAPHRLLLSRLGEPLSRPALRRVYDASGGNPFYALEIARFLLEAGTTLGPAEPPRIPRTLAGLVQARLEGRRKRSGTYWRWWSAAGWSVPRTTYQVPAAM